MRDVNCLDLVVHLTCVYQFYSLFLLNHLNQLRNLINYFSASSSSSIITHSFLTEKSSSSSPHRTVHFIDRWLSHQLFLSGVLNNSRSIRSASGVLTTCSLVYLRQELLFIHLLLNFTVAFVSVVPMLDVALKLFILTGASTFMGKQSILM